MCTERGRDGKIAQESQLSCPGRSAAIAFGVMVNHSPVIRVIVNRKLHTDSQEALVEFQNKTSDQRDHICVQFVMPVGCQCTRGLSQ